jgi:hypothetical protein
MPRRQLDLCLSQLHVILQAEREMKISSSESFDYKRIYEEYVKGKVCLTTPMWEDGKIQYSFHMYCILDQVTINAISFQV